MYTENYYRILGLTPSATEDEIKATYRRLAKKYHPDLHMNDKSNEEKFKRINIAYSILSDPHKKKAFDLTLIPVEIFTNSYSSNKHSTYPPHSIYNNQKKKNSQTRITIFILMGLSVFLFLFLLGISRLSSEQNYAAGMEYFQRKQFNDAIDSFEYAIWALGSKSSEACSKLSEIYLYHWNHYPLALRYCNEALEYTSDEQTMAQIFYLRAITLKKMGQYEEAIQDLSLAENNGYNKDSIYKEVGNIYTYNLKQYVSGHRAFSKLITISSSSEIGWFGKAWCEQHLNLYHEAIESYSMVISMNPNAAKSYYYRGVNETIVEDNNKACEDFKMAKMMGVPLAEERYGLYCLN
ncbi:J domain-containing protein [Fulvivirga sediminis]|uniref:DnaJ domain-containing protein n=1 Tax=Fulvivirga sediminis TaxID=2803949 RepID=A0A937K1D0_9BACT|nr:DnaJ domain-containing protein [Fulvivirga sediminis]MBL3657341.1 DnaJ domain-containing protein [Fulvivirga sediminis]